jgi:hypothetical protein
MSGGSRRLGRAIATRVAFAALEAAGANIDILANKAGQC